MPIISRFFGIIITMNWLEHNPPHFHARYGEYEFQVGIKPISIIAGTAPPRVQAMVIEWALLHQEELLKDWEFCKNNQMPELIAPLE